MHSLLAALNRGEGFRPGTAHKPTDFNVGGDFAAFFNRSIARVSGGAALNGGVGVENLLSRLRERFPDAKIAERDVPPGLEESKKAAGDDGDTTSDKVNLTKPLLEEMGLDAGLAGKIEDILAGLFSGDKASPPGSYVQRSVTLTVTTVRYTEMQRSNEDNGILAAGELQTALREKIDEMLAELSGALERVFGKRDTEGGAGKTDGSGTADGTAKGSESTEAGKAAKPGKVPGASSGSASGGAFAEMWSMELFYSSITSVQKSISSDGNLYLNASQTKTTWSSASLAVGYGSFGGLMGGEMPEFLQQLLEGGSDSKSGSGNSNDSGGGRTGGSGVPGSIERALADSAIRFSGYRQVEEGFSFKFTQSRNLIEELMELYGERLGGGRGRRDGAAGADGSAPAAEGGADGAAAVEADAVEEEEALAV